MLRAFAAHELGASTAAHHTSELRRLSRLSLSITKNEEQLGNWQRVATYL